ncbi:MAG: UDP-3-O-acyl-N-acetylglucosamine deacetylase [Pseudolabrys sp.]|nr:UDP-3-O-acyl-N-acetylglucosamine deacetylase [Pseudolabrys sp.]
MTVAKPGAKSTTATTLQTTLLAPVSVSGIGVHSGLPATLTLHPAPAHHGIVFSRLGRAGEPDREILADVRAVTATDFATVLGDAKGPLCSTAEHVLSALRGLGIDNVVVEIDGPEAPIMDGSAADFIAAVDRAGIRTLEAPRKYIEVLKTIRVARKDGASGELAPYARGFRVEAEIDFSEPLIGRQSYALDVTADSFRREISRARTFGFMRDVARLWSAGYALGASFDNTLVISDNRVMNPEGVRFADEFVRHKVLDAVGDLALAGAPLLGVYRSVRGGHGLNHAVLSALMADPTAWRLVDPAPARRPRSVVGAMVEPLGVPASGLPAGLAVPAYGPSVS